MDFSQVFDPFHTFVSHILCYDLTDILFYLAGKQQYEVVRDKEPKIAASTDIELEDAWRSKIIFLPAILMYTYQAIHYSTKHAVCSPMYQATTYISGQRRTFIIFELLLHYNN